MQKENSHRKDVAQKNAARKKAKVNASQLTLWHAGEYDYENLPKSLSLGVVSARHNDA